MNDTSPSPAEARASTGIAGLDDILGGGLPVNHLYLLDGEPGSGKTTIALQFLLAGVARGERGLYVTLSESRAELTGVAASHGWKLDGLEIFELSAATIGQEEYTLFHPAEVELQETMDSVLRVLDSTGATRVVFDSLSEMRLLARDALRFRRQVLALKQFFSTRPGTVLLLDDKTSPDGDMQLHSIAHGVVNLEHIAMDYGAERRRLQVLKLRGTRFWGGYHDFRITTGGVAVFPRIRHTVPAAQSDEPDLASGSPEIDALLGGGITCGTSTLITGAAGTGKTTLSLAYVQAAVKRGERVRMYLFDERVTTFRMRARALDLDVSNAIDEGRLTIVQVEPTQMSPGEFANDVVRAVENDKVSMIVVDSINGFMNAMPSERLLGIQLHELLSYLAGRRVSIILTLVQRGVFGHPVDEAAEVSYLADTVVLLRYFEFKGSVRQAISVVKKRSGAHEKTIRECRVGRGGLIVGEPLTEFHGVLTGVPQYTGSQAPMLLMNDQFQPT